MVRIISGLTNSLNPVLQSENFPRICIALKMPKYKSKYKKKWEKEDDGTGNKIGVWCRKENDYEAKCSFCNGLVDVSNKGKSALKKHAKSETHKEKLLVDAQPSNSSASVAAVIEDNLDSFQNEEQNLDDQIRTAEAIFSAMVAEHDIAFLFSDHFTKNVYKMFPDSAIAAGFRSCRTKTNYMICDGMAVDIQLKLLDKIRKIPFSLLIDESNKQYGKKFLCAMVKFYDTDQDNISIRFLDIFVCNDGSADAITQKVVDMFDRNNLSFENLIHIMTDNPNVMRGKYNGVVTQITSKHAKHLIDIGGCSLHHVSNSVSNSLPELHRFEFIEQLLQNTSAFFSFHIQFAEKFTDIQQIFNLESHKLLQYTEIRFLSVLPVVDRLIEQYEAVNNLFMNYIPKYHPKVAQQMRVININEVLRNVFTLPTLHFISFVLQSFQKYEKLFQREEPTIHILFDQQVDLYRGTLLHFCVFSKVKALRKSEDLVKFDFNHKTNKKPLEEISVGVSSKKFFSKFSEQEKILFLSGVQMFYQKVCKEMLQKLSLKNKFLSNLRFLNPENIPEGQKMVMYCASKMPPISKLTDKDIDALSIEWQLLRLEELPAWYKHEGNKVVYEPIDKYWGKIISQTSRGELKYPVLEKVVRFALSIAEANGSVERLFSQLLHMIPKEKSNLETHTIKGLLTTKSFLQTNGSCTDLTIDDSMMYHIKASHSNYRERNLERNKTSDGVTEERLSKEVKKQYNRNKKLKAIEDKEAQLQKQDDVVKTNEIKALSLLKEAQSIMQDSQQMNKTILKEREKLQKSKSRIEESILQSTCHTAAKKLKMLSSKRKKVDLNNNNNDNGDNSSDSSD